MYQLSIEVIRFGKKDKEYYLNVVYSTRLYSIISPFVTLGFSVNLPKMF